MVPISNTGHVWEGWEVAVGPLDKCKIPQILELYDSNHTCIHMYPVKPDCLHLHLKYMCQKDRTVHSESWGGHSLPILSPFSELLVYKRLSNSVFCCVSGDFSRVLVI